MSYVFTEPNAVSNLIASQITPTSVLLNWRENGMRSFFRVNWTKSTISISTSFNVTNLTSGENYTFIVSAVAFDNVTEGDSVSLTVCTGKFTRCNLVLVIF